MKKIQLYLADFTIFLILVSLKIWACPGQCNEEWNYSTTPLVADTNQCWVLINYRWRVCEINGDTVREVEITSIDKVTGGNCDNTSTEAIMMIAVKSILFHSSGIFMIQNPTIPYDITLNIPSCWRTSNNNNQSTLVACNSALCCRTKVTMQTVDDWPQAVNQTPVSPPIPQNCSGIIGYTCDYICNSIDVPLYEPLIPWHYDYSYLCFQACPDTLKRGYVVFQYNTNTIDVAYIALGGCNISTCGDLGRINYQLQITHIQVIHKNDSVYSSRTYEIIHQSNRQILKHFGKSIEKRMGASRIKVRLFVRQCWKPFVSLGDWDYLAYPCSLPVECCYRDFYVGKDTAGRWSVLDACPAIIVEPDSCGRQICTNGCQWLYFCPNDVPWSYCDVLNDYYGGYLREGIDEPYNPDAISFGFQERIIKNNLTLEIESYGIESIELQIFDVMGNTIEKLEHVLKNGVNFIEVNMTERNLSNGVYFYKIVERAKTLAFGMFIHLK